MQKPPAVGAAAAKRHADERDKKIKRHKEVFDFATNSEQSDPSRGEMRQWWCTYCFQRIAGCGINSEVRTCAKARAHKGFGRRVRLSWKILRNNPRAKDFLLAAREHQWIRDLTGDGDIESNPGPDVNNPIQTKPNELKVLSFNAGGGKGTWASLDLIFGEHPHVVFLQETALLPTEASGFINHVQQKGYHAFFAGAQCEGQRPHGGAMVLVRKSLKCSPAWASTQRGGAAQAVWINGTMCVSVYLAPVQEAISLADEIAALILSLPPQHPWVLAGDFNFLPTQHPFLTTLEELGGVTVAPMEPTRWAGQRAIDYFYTNVHLDNLETLPFKVSDHKMLVARWCAHTQAGPSHVLKKSPMLPPPPKDKVLQWEAFVAQD